MSLLLFLANPSDNVIYDSIELSVQSSSPTQSRIQPHRIDQGPQDQLIPSPQQNLSTDDQPTSDLGSDSKTDSKTDSNAFSEQIATGSEITTPVRLISSIKANRTDAARRADYSGISIVELVVGSNGSVLQAQLMNQLDYGLNEVALDIARKLKFKPAMIGSKTVATKVNLKIKFTSKD